MFLFQDFCKFRCVSSQTIIVTVRQTVIVSKLSCVVHWLIKISINNQSNYARVTENHQEKDVCAVCLKQTQHWHYITPNGLSLTAMHQRKIIITLAFMHCFYAVKANVLTRNINQFIKSNTLYHHAFTGYLL